MRATRNSALNPSYVDGAVAILEAVRMDVSARDGGHKQVKFEWPDSERAAGASTVMARGEVYAPGIEEAQMSVSATIALVPVSELPH